MRRLLSIISSFESVLSRNRWIDTAMPIKHSIPVTTMVDTKIIDIVKVIHNSVIENILAWMPMAL